ncbi:MAG: alpha/beta fold hydrolase [Ilumatobacteraceae bacterium]
MAVPAAIRERSAGGFGWRESGTGGAGNADDGATMVLLHGLMGSRLSWEPQLAALGAACRVVAWDAPGYGMSVPLAGHADFAAFADAVARLLDVLDVERAHLVGLSFGGMIAQYVARRHPSRLATLSLLSTSPKFGLDGTSPDAWRRSRLAALDAGERPVDLAPRVLASIAGPGIGEEALAGQVAAAALVPSSALRVAVDVLVTHDSRPWLGELAAPTVVLVGEADRETPVDYAQAIASSVSGASLHVIAGAGHLLNVEAPDEVNALIARHAGLSWR